MAIPINLRTTGSVMVVEGTTPLARMEINVPLTASSLSINSISLTSGSVAGDLIINGTLIANEFKTTITSASITYRSGSTKQGDSLDDIHEVTGSLRMSTGSGISGSLSGSFFGVTQGSVQGTEGLTGSLQRLVSGLTYLVAGTRILITTQSNGQIQIDAIAADVSGSYVTIGNTGSLPNERALIAGTGILANDGGPGNVITLLINDNVVATLSGSTFQGPVVAGYGLSGSVQRLDTGQTYLAAGPNVSIQSQSSGQVIISAVGLADVSASYIVFGTTGSLPNERAIQAGAGIAFIDNGVGGSLIVKATGEGSADVSGSYVTLDTTGSLPNERRLAASTGIQIIDNGPGATVDVAINNNVVATLSGSTFSGPVVANGGLTGSLQNVSANVPYLQSAGSNVNLTTQSNGSVLIEGGKGVVAAGNVTVQNNVKYIIFSGTVASPTASLSAQPALWQEHIFKDGDGTSPTWPIIVSASVGYRIDNVNAFEISSSYGYRRVVYVGGNLWSVLGSGTGG